MNSRGLGAGKLWVSSCCFLLNVQDMRITLDVVVKCDDDEKHAALPDRAWVILCSCVQHGS